MRLPFRVGRDSSRRMRRRGGGSLGLGGRESRERRSVLGGGFMRFGWGEREGMSEESIDVVALGGI